MTSPGPTTPTPPSRRMLPVALAIVAAIGLGAGAFIGWSAQRAEHRAAVLQALGVPAPGQDYPAALHQAGDRLAAALAAGTPVGMEAEQVQTILPAPGPTATPDLAQRAVPEPTLAPGETPGPRILARYLTRARHDARGYSAEIRDAGGPDPVTFAAAEPLYAWTQIDGGSWRADLGRAWSPCPAACQPGHGIDSVTLSRLPVLLRSGLVDPAPVEADGRSGWSGTADPADWPGLIAPDATGHAGRSIRVAVFPDEDGMTLRGAATDGAGMVEYAVTLRISYAAAPDHPVIPASPASAPGPSAPATTGEEAP